jgi:hypothetical protein
MCEFAEGGAWQIKNFHVITVIFPYGFRDYFVFILHEYLSFLSAYAGFMSA